MIEVIYYPRFNAVTVKGHAGFAEEGKDIICAGVSAIAWTLAEAAAKLASEGKAMEPKIKMASGRAEISVDALPKHEEYVRDIFGYICGGFKRMAEQSPEYISYIVRA